MHSTHFLVEDDENVWSVDADTIEQLNIWASNVSAASSTLFQQQRNIQARATLDRVANDIEGSTRSDRVVIVKK